MFFYPIQQAFQLVQLGIDHGFVADVVVRVKHSRQLLAEDGRVFRCFSIWVLMNFCRWKKRSREEKEAKLTPLPVSRSKLIIPAIYLQVPS